MTGHTAQGLVPISRLGRFDVVDRLGAGGMAEVLLAFRRSEGFSRAVALKRVLPQFAAQPRFRAMLRREAALAALLHHPHCVEVLDLEETPEDVALVMELLYGLDAAALAERARRRTQVLPTPVAVGIVCDAARGLAHAHALTDVNGASLEVVHRDVSPHNLFVTETGITKVLDFGIAKAAVESGDEVTRTGVLKGKYRYMPPEQLLAERLDCSADVYALAVSAWELITGTPLFDTGLLQAVERARAGATITLRDRPAASSLSARLVSALERALETDRSSRTPTMDAFRRELTAACPPASSDETTRCVASLAGQEIAKLHEQVRRESSLQRSGGDLPSIDRDAQTSPGARISLPSAAPSLTRASRRPRPDTIRMDDEVTARAFAAESQAAARETTTAPELDARGLAETLERGAPPHVASAPRAGHAPRADTTAPPVARRAPRDTVRDRAPPLPEAPRTSLVPPRADVPARTRSFVPDVAIFALALLVGALLAYFLPA